MEPDSAKKKKGLPCPRCGNRLRVRPDQIGTQVMCPKCNSTFTVGRPEAQPTAPASSGDSYEPEMALKRASIVPEEETLLASDSPPEARILHEPPSPLDPTSMTSEEMTELATSAPLAQEAHYEADWSSGDGALEAESAHVRPAADEPDYLALAKQRGLLRERRGAEAPKWTFFSGVFAFPWRGTNLARWVVLSLGLILSGELLVAIVENLRSGISLGGPLLFMVAAATTLLVFLFAAPCFLAAVEDTAEGLDEVQESSFPELNQWLFSAISLASVWFLSGAIGFPLTLIESIGPPAVPLSMVLLFPVILLSALECESFLAPISLPVLASLHRAWRAWLVFYLVSTLLVAVWAVLAGLTMPSAPYLAVLVMAPALGAVILIYARLLGRLGWYISGGAVADGSGADGGPGAKQKARRRRRRGRIKMPNDLDAAAQLVADEPRPLAPPVNSQRRR